MAKVSFAKLGMSKTIQTVTIEWQDEIIEIKQYLPIQEKLGLVERVINKALDESNKYYNIGQLTVLLDLELIYAYTNISFTEKQKADFLKIYDLLNLNGLLNDIKQAIPETEILQLTKWTIESVEQIYKYNNSVLGILDIMQQNHDALNFDVSKIVQDLSTNENFDLLKEVAPLIDLA